MKYIILFCIAALSIAAAVVLTPPPAFAQACQSISDVLTIIEKADGELIDLIDVNGDGFDQVIIAEMAGTILVGKALNGCTVGGPSVLGTSVPVVDL